VKVFLTGAAGFIGSHLFEALIKSRYKVSAVDNFDDYYSRDFKIDNLNEVKRIGKITFSEVDILNKKALNKKIKNWMPDIVIHLAARPGVRASFNNPLLYARINVEGTLNLLEAIKKIGIPRLVFASSSSVYGNATTPFREDDESIQPISPYGISKLVAEKYCRVYSQLYGIKIIVLRFFSVYGPRQRPDMGIYKFVDAIINQSPITIYGNLKIKRDWTFIDDIIKGVMHSITREDNFEIFNLGNSKPLSLGEIIDIIEKITSTRAKIKFAPPHKGDPKITYAYISKSQRVLGFSPSTDVKEGLKIFVRWFSNKRMPVR
jgi:UDP-glucuronate 4-epimerase